MRTLQEQLEKAKESLKNVDENIRKLTGRDPNDVRPIQARLLALSGPGGGRGRGSLLLRRGFSDSGGGPQPNRETLKGQSVGWAGSVGLGENHAKKATQRMTMLRGQLCSLQL